MPDELHIALTPPVAESVGVDALGALLDAPRGKALGSVLLAHGAGASKEAAFLATFARGWADAGLRVLRFDFPYMERARREGKRRPPDRMPKLLASLREVRAFVRREIDDGPWFLAGKSMGSRAATLAAAGEDGAPLDTPGLVLLGYPLHPPKKPEKLRSDHFDRLDAPSLFVSGTRDPLCDLELLERERAKIPGESTLFVVDGGDHDLAVPKRSGRTHDEVLAETIERSAAWMAERA